jgi:hypothetical protein
MPLVRRSIARAAKNLVQRSLRRKILGQSLVDACAASGKATRSLPLQALRPQAAVALPPEV